jgi:hypothetical protein
MDLIPPSVVKSYDVSHLHALAAHMTKSAADREELMGSVNGLTAGQMWVGAGREGQAVPLAEHNVQATTTAAALAATAAEATAGAETLYLQKQGLVAGLQVGKTAGFEVDDEYNVTDPFEGTPAGVIRAPLARTLQSQLQAGAQVFTQTEHATAQAIHTSMGTVGGGTAAHGGQPEGKVQCFGPDQSPYCVERHPDGSTTTIPPGQAVWGMQGVWPDAAKNGEGKVSMFDSHFKTAPADPTEPPMPPVGSDKDEDMLISSTSGQASTQSGLGVEDTRLPAMPKEWPPAPSAPSPTCTTDEFGKILTKATEHTAIEAGGIAILPEEGPAVIPGIVGLLVNGNNIADDVGDAAHCFSEGVGN